jgi:SAM-dependent methyltransferase
VIDATRTLNRETPAALWLLDRHVLDPGELSFLRAARQSGLRTLAVPCADLDVDTTSASATSGIEVLPDGRVREIESREHLNVNYVAAGRVTPTIDAAVAEVSAACRPRAIGWHPVLSELLDAGPLRRCLDDARRLGVDVADGIGRTDNRNGRTARFAALVFLHPRQVTVAGGGMSGPSEARSASAAVARVVDRFAAALACWEPLTRRAEFVHLALLLAIDVDHPVGDGDAPLVAGWQPLGLQAAADRKTDLAAVTVCLDALCRRCRRAPAIEIPVPAVRATGRSYPDGGANDHAAPHPLAAVMPRMGSHAVVSTRRWPDARFTFLDRRLDGPPVPGESTRTSALLAYLGRVVDSDPTFEDAAAKRYVEPGVGRACLVDGLRVRDRPELEDFTVTGVGQTPYSSGGFVDLGVVPNGLVALARAVHRRRCAELLEEAGCRVAPVVAVIELPGEHVLMPDGTFSPAALIVRGFRTVLRLKQLDPIGGFYHSTQHGARVGELLLDAALWGEADATSDSAARQRLGLALDRWAAVAEELRWIFTYPGGITSPDSQALGLRRKAVRAYAPVLIDIARRRLGKELFGEEAAAPTPDEYADWFARTLGRQLRAMRRVRFLHDYHHEGVSRHRAAWVHTLAETNVTLLAELPDLDTGLFVDAPEDELRADIQLDRSDVEVLRREFEGFHHREVEAARRLASTLALVVADGDEAARRRAEAAFRRSYAGESGEGRRRRDPTRRSGVVVNGRPELPALWQACLRLEYDQPELMAGLEEWLDHDRSLRILDCACGTGFPALDLLTRGYDVTCSDGSEAMVSIFARNARSAGLAVVPTLVEWKRLPSVFGPVFDVVMCRGSSLVYAGTWDDDVEPSRTAVGDAVASFVRCLRDGGRLYVDTTSRVNLRATEPVRTSYPPIELDGHRVRVEEVIENDVARRRRTWRSTLTVDGAEFSFSRRSYYLRHEELERMMVRAGLTDVGRADVRGEHYDVFVGRRP